MIVCHCHVVNDAAVAAAVDAGARTLYEVCCADFGARIVLAPSPPDGFKVALDELDVLPRLFSSARLLLWLDRVTRFLSPPSKLPSAWRG